MKAVTTVYKVLIDHENLLFRSPEASETPNCRSEGQEGAGGASEEGGDCPRPRPRPHPRPAHPGRVPATSAGQYSLASDPFLRPLIYYCITGPVTALH